MMKEFEDYIFNEVSDAISGIEADLRSDIYVLSFFIKDIEDDPRRPTLKVGYNTTARWLDCTPKEGQAARWPIASDKHEAQWNYAFWLQNEVKLIGDTDTESGRLLTELLQLQGFWYPDEAEESDFDDCMRIGEKTSAYFVDFCVQLARRLHNSGAVMKVFGRAVPIIVHELEYYDQIALHAEEANPPGLAKEFARWARGDV